MQLREMNTASVDDEVKVMGRTLRRALLAVLFAWLPVNYPGESPVLSGGVRIQNWTNVSGNQWKTSLPTSTRYFEQLYYDGVPRLRPRVGGPLGTYLLPVLPLYLSSPGPPAAPPAKLPDLCGQ